MRQAKGPTEKELSEGYESVPLQNNTVQPRQNARLYGEEFPSWESESETETSED